MPKLRWDADGEEPDWGAMEDEEYEEGGDFAPYEGPQPPKNTLLSGDIKKVWVVSSQAGNRMFKVLWEAARNTGDKEKYNGLAIWENVVWTTPAKFKWQPFLDGLGITLRAVQKATITAEDEDNVGLPVERINKLRFPAPLRVLTDSEVYEGERRTKVNKWLAPAKDEDEDDDEFEDGDEPPF
jgi:hypothetical protein